MAIVTEDNAALFTNIVVNVPLNNDYPLFAEDEVEVVYGSQALRAVLNVDFTVQLNTSDFSDFTITPLASLLTKINDLIATPPTTEPETNFVVVRRVLDYTTSVQPETVRYTNFLSREIDRIHMRFIQLAEQLSRAITLPANVVGNLIDIYIVGEPSEGKAPVWRGNKLVAEIDADLIASAQGFAEDAQQALADTQDVYDDTVVVKNDTITARNAAQAAQLQAELAAVGINWKKAHAATTGALPACTYANGASGVGATLTGNANGAITSASFDGVVPVVGKRYVVKNQAASLQNGVYTLTQLGSAGTPFILTRAVDADAWSELVSQVVVLEEGTTLADQAYMCTINDGGTVGVTAIVWGPFNPPLADGAVSTTAKLADGIVTYIKMAAAAFATTALELYNGTASKIVNAATLKLYSEAYLSRKVYSGVPVAGANYEIPFQFRAGYNYRIRFDDVEFSAAGAAAALQTSPNNGSSYDAGASDYAWRRTGGTTGNTGDASASSSGGIFMLYTPDINYPTMIEIRLFNPAAGGKRPFFEGFMFGATGGVVFNTTFYASRLADVVCDKLRIINVTFKAQGTVTVYEEPI